MAYAAQPVSFLADVTRRVRNYIHDPAEFSKWTDDLLWPMIVDAWQRIMYDVTAVSEHPLTVRYFFTTDGVSQRYLLPGNMGTFLRLGTVGDSGYFNDVGGGRSRLNAWGAGYLLEGNWLRFEPNFTSVLTFAVDYLPSGECPMHYSTTPASSFTNNATADTTTFALDTTPDEGYYDSRPGIYIGSVVRLLGDAGGQAPSGYNVFPVQERMIVGANANNNTVAVSPRFDFNVAGSGLSNIRYEILPMFGRLFRDVVAWHTVALIRATMGDISGEAAALRRANLSMRQIRLQAAHANGRSGGRFAGDLPGNPRFDYGWGFDAF